MWPKRKKTTSATVGVTTASAEVRELFEFRSRQFLYWDANRKEAKRCLRRYWLLRFGVELTVLTILFLILFPLCETIRFANLSTIPESIHVLGFGSGISVSLTILITIALVTDCLNFALNYVAKGSFVEAQFARQYHLARTHWKDLKLKNHDSLPCPNGSLEHFAEKVAPAAKRITPLSIALCGGWWAWWIAKIQLPRWIFALGFVLVPLLALSYGYTRIDDGAVYFRTSRSKPEVIVPFAQIKGIELVRETSENRKKKSVPLRYYRLVLNNDSRISLIAESFDTAKEDAAATFIASKSGVRITKVEIDSSKDDTQKPSATKQPGKG